MPAVGSQLGSGKVYKVYVIASANITGSRHHYITSTFHQHHYLSLHHHINYHTITPLHHHPITPLPYHTITHIITNHHHHSITPIIITMLIITITVWTPFPVSAQDESASPVKQTRRVSFWDNPVAMQTIFDQLIRGVCRIV